MQINYIDKMEAIVERLEKTEEKPDWDKEMIEIDTVILLAEEDKTVKPRDLNRLRKIAVLMKKEYSSRFEPKKRAIRTKGLKPRRMPNPEAEANEKKFAEILNKELDAVTPEETAFVERWHFERKEFLKY